MIYRALSPWLSVDPYGQAAQNQLMITNLRVRLLQRQPCPCQAKHPGTAVLPTDHYAIYDFIVKGSCLCNGHADHCVRARGYQPSHQKTNNMVSAFDFVNIQCLKTLMYSLFCCENLFWNRMLKSVNCFCLSPFFVYVMILGVDGLGFIFPPLPCYSAVQWYVLLKLKAAVKTGY